MGRGHRGGHLFCAERVSDYVIANRGVGYVWFDQLETLLCTKGTASIAGAYPDAGHSRDLALPDKFASRSANSFGWTDRIILLLELDVCVGFSATGARVCSYVDVVNRGAVLPVVANHPDIVASALPYARSTVALGDARDVHIVHREDGPVRRNAERSV